MGELSPPFYPSVSSSVKCLEYVATLPVRVVVRGNVFVKVMELGTVNISHY